MKKIIVFAFLALLIVGVSYAIVKVPSTIVKTNVTTTKLNVTTILKTNITTNESNDTTPTMTKPELISDVPKKLPKNVTPTNATICVGCAISPHLANITPELIAPIPCDGSNTGYLNHSYFSGHHANFGRPSYINNSSEDCDLLGLDNEITTDLNNKLQIVDQIEARVNATENESHALLQRGKNAINCLGTAEHGLEAAGMSPSFPSLSSIGGSYGMGGIYGYVLNQLKNFHRAYENVHTGYNYSNASMETLRSAVLGLEEMCRNRVCVFPEDKEYYEDKLEHEQYEASYYANRTKYFIDDARDFAQSYHDLKDNIDRSECLDFVTQSVQNAPWKDIQFENLSNKTPKQLISPVKLAKNFSGVKNVTLVGGEKPKYVIQSKQKKKLLWVFDVELETQTEVNAQNGQIIKEEKPWWSFLVGE